MNGDRPSIEELAVQYADIANGYHVRMPKLEAQVDDLMGAVLRIEGKLERLYQRLGGSNPPGVYRTVAHGFNVSDSQKVDLREVEGAIERIEKERDIAKAKSEALAEAAAARHKQVQVWLPIVVAGATFAGWLLTHVLHLWSGQ